MAVNPTKILLYDLGEELRQLLQDLLDGQDESKSTVIERLSDLEIYALDEGNFEETFLYTNGDVTKHTCTGDANFEVDYKYKSDGSGELENSVKTFKRKNGDIVEVKKTYTYDSNGDITNIQTITTVTPPQPQLAP